MKLNGLEANWIRFAKFEERGLNGWSQSYRYTTAA